jgi:hypothetical protein
MNNNNKKRKKLSNLKPRTYKIYGIFNFITDDLIYVNLDMEKTTLEFELEGYDSEQYDIISFDVVVS